MEKTVKRSLSILLVVVMLCSVFSISVSAVARTVTLRGGTRMLNGVKYTATLNETFLNMESDTYIADDPDGNPVVYTIDKENHAVTFYTADDGYFYLPEYFFALEGYTQNGWCNSSSSNSGNYAAGRKIKISSDKIYYARYETKKYSVEFLPGELGEGEVRTNNYNYGAPITLYNAIFTRPGYIQVGWATAENAAEAEYSLQENYKVYDNVSFYPVWEPVVIDFVKNPESVDFGLICEGSIADVSPVKVSIQNISNTEVSIAVPESEYYDISCSATDVEIGRYFSVEISPKTTLAAGEYNETLVFGVVDTEEFFEIATDFTVLAADGHSIGDWVITTQPSCTEVGSKCKPCSVCGYKTEITAIPANGHSFVGSDCSVCGECMFSYEITEAGVTITGILYPQEEIVIPAYINELPVISIGEKAFYDCDDVTSVEISEGVSYIGAEAFSSCRFLNTISIPSSIKSVGSSAFVFCNALESINIVDIKSWCDIRFEDPLANPLFDIYGIIDGKEYTRGLYIDGVKVNDISIPDGVTSINDYAFAGYMSIESVEISDGVQTIGEGAFVYCTALQSVAIGKGVTGIGSIPFLYCTSLRNISVDEENTSYASADGVLFDKAETTLIQYPVQKEDTEYVIPSTVKTIEVSAFYDADNLVSVEIPDGVESIGDQTFNSCGSLNFVEIPDSVINIGYDILTGTAYFNDANNWEDDVLYIGNHLIKSHNQDMVYIIREGTKTIAGSAFENCTELLAIEIPDSVVAIGDSAFLRSGLMVLRLNEGVVEIGDYAFSSTRISEVEIPESVKRIGEGAFSSTEMEFVMIPATVTELGAEAFVSEGEEFNGEFWCEENSAAHLHAVEYNIDYELMRIKSVGQTVVDYREKIIKTSKTACNDIAEIITFSESTESYVAPSLSVGNTAFYGTGTDISALGYDPKYDYYTGYGFTLVVLGDVNGDSVCDVLDAAQVATASSELTGLTGAYALAADSNEDNVIDVTDYQAIVNKAVA